MKFYIIILIRKLQDYLSRWTNPPNDELVCAIVLHTASLELSKSEFVELAPIQGCCGPFKLSGNSLPVFEYTVFEKKIMEFVRVRVEMSKPDRIEYRATIESKNTSDPGRHGENLEVIDKYKAPFQKLIWHLFRYFPYYRARGNGVKNEEKQ